MTYRGERYAPPRLLSPLDIMEIGIVRCAYKNQRHYVVSLIKTEAHFTSISHMHLPMYSMRIFDLDIEG